MIKYYKTPSRFLAVHNIEGVEFCVNIDIAANSVEWIQFNLVKSIYMVECSREEVKEAFSKVNNSLSILI